MAHPFLCATNSAGHAAAESLSPTLPRAKLITSAGRRYQHLMAISTSHLDIAKHLMAISINKATPQQSSCETPTQYTDTETIDNDTPRQHTTPDNTPHQTIHHTRHPDSRLRDNRPHETPRESVAVYCLTLDRAGQAARQLALETACTTPSSRWAMIRHRHRHPRHSDQPHQSGGSKRVG